MEEIRVGLVGVGALGRLHMRSLATIPGCRLTRVADHRVSTALAAEIADAGATVTDLDGVLDPTDVDAVVVATPTDGHAPIVRAAVERGLAVFCEKPLARTPAQALAIRDLAAERGVKVAVGHVVRYFPEYAAARELVRAGELGQPGCARLARLNASPGAVQKWYADSARSGGVLLDMAIHDIDWCLWTFGPVARVYAVCAGEPSAEVAAVTLRHANGAISYIDASWRNDFFGTRLELWGSAGYYLTTGSTDAGLTVGYSSSQGTDYLPGTAAEPAAENPFRVELEAAIDWFRGGPAPLASAADAYEAIRVAAAAEQSARRRVPMTLTGADAS